ncbi:MAG TPA: signal recognition particle-docking protein FtsY [Rhodanobacteraceae bacterium]|nr:signal recognition particle-docking protein FtsY [Rhodanobacteraceae bacterium]
MFKFWKKSAKDADKAAPVEGAPAAPDPAAGAVPAAAPPAAATLADAASLVSPPSHDGATGASPVEAASAPPRRSWRERLGGSAFARGLGALFTRQAKLDDALLDELETCLLTADVGVAASTELVEALRRRMARREFADAAALLAALREALVGLLRPVATPLHIDAARRPYVLLMVGVNGVGKTTTIGKLARRYVGEGRSVLLAAGDTFRAAAVEQLKTWGERNQVAVIAQGSGADAASVIFDALQAARSRQVDVLIADTAGRLHTQSGLMDELGKIRRVLGKLDAEAPHEVLLVIDGTTGQNAVNQVRQFRDAIGVTGLVVTKLDGTAKGGVVFALAREFGLPIRYVGLGESADDLRVFDPAAFVDGLLPEHLGGD